MPVVMAVVLVPVVKENSTEKRIDVKTFRAGAGGGRATVSSVLHSATTTAADITRWVARGSTVSVLPTLATRRPTTQSGPTALTTLSLSTTYHFNEDAFDLCGRPAESTLRRLKQSNPIYVST